jgi:flavin reductase (DIM6/NTAB) family NADH-FMN oxidoreductase RutF
VGQHVAAHEQLIAETKSALRRLASSVVVVTCRSGDTRHAMTVTAVNAMSMNPPSMIVCVNRAGAFHRAISDADCFAVNILRRSQVKLSVGCAGQAHGEDRFGSGEWGEDGGAPVLLDAQARIVCATEARFGYGSHTLFCGRVISVGTHGAVDPLIYVDGQYVGLAAAEAVELSQPVIPGRV